MDDDDLNRREFVAVAAACGAIIYLQPRQLLTRNRAMSYSTDLDPLREKLDEWGIKHFKAKELTLLKDPDWTGPKHVCPPPAQLNHMATTIKTADLIRTLWGRHFADGRIKVVSGYRPDAYNKLIKGAPESCHKYFRALDLQPMNGEMKTFCRVVESVMETLDFRGLSTGLGLYANFCHIDTLAVAEHKAHKRRWDMR